nr:hypothetical protein [uncultured bacterium]
MKVHELKKLLRKNGWTFKRQGKGDHEIWEHPDFDNNLSLDGKGSDDVPKGLLHDTIKKAGLK